MTKKKGTKEGESTIEGLKSAIDGAGSREHKVSENKESKNGEKSVKVKEVGESDKKEDTKQVGVNKTPTTHGKGGQFVDIGGGIKVPLSEIDQN